jgi:ech hydrogenase subunit F
MANMLQLILKNLVTKQSTRLYPIEKERDTFERSRGRIVMDPNTCILCGICARKCPADAITVERGNGKWELDAYRCIICGECAAACPKKSITLTNERRHSSEGKLFEGHHVEPPKPVAKPVAPRPTIVPTPTPAPAPGSEATTAPAPENSVQ